MARPSEFTQEHIEQAEKLCSLGATDYEIADFFGVSVRTIYRWKLEHPLFCQSIKSGKEVADERIERSLYERASGFAYVEQQAIKVKCGPHEEKVEIVEVERVSPPDPTSMIFWLKNRRPADWREKTQTELTGPNGGPVQITEVKRTIIDPKPQ